MIRNTVNVDVHIPNFSSRIDRAIIDSVNATLASTQSILGASTN
ncbi:MAG: hypothetical protein ACX939_06490 [Hyphococcus sp.]